MITSLTQIDIAKIDGIRPSF